MHNTAGDHLTAFLLSCRSTRIYRKILWERLSARRKHLSKSTFNQNIYRLQKRGVIKSKGDYIHIYQTDLRKLKATSVMKGIFPQKTEKILVSFDIPETKKKIRDWLRNQIKYWDFEMIHKSLWLGDGPFP